jgi:hypothetical protein
MQIEEIKAKQMPRSIPGTRSRETVLQSSVEAGKFDMAAIRRAREIGLDRLDETADRHAPSRWSGSTKLHAVEAATTGRSIRSATSTT